MKEYVFNDIKVLFLIFLFLLKAIQIINSYTIEKENNLFLLTKREQRILFWTKRSQQFSYYVENQRKNHIHNCEFVFVSTKIGSVVDVESDIQNKISSFAKKYNIEISSFTWGSLSRDSQIEGILYLPFSLVAKGKIDYLVEFLCSLASLKKLIIVKSLTVDLSKKGIFIANLNSSLVFLQNGVCTDFY